MKTEKDYCIVDPAGAQFLWTKIEHPRFKYEVLKDYRIQLHFCPKETVISRYYVFTRDGMLLIRRGYRWDGASGPTIDTISTMRASAVHDVIYQMIRQRELSYSYKRAGDCELSMIMKEDYHPNNVFSSLWSDFRSGYYLIAVSLFGGFACKPGT